MSKHNYYSEENEIIFRCGKFPTSSRTQILLVRYGARNQEMNINKIIRILKVVN